jgi:hypothetical protein
MSQAQKPQAPEVSLEVWRELYRTAVEFQTLAPWRWMNDDHGLGIHSENGVRVACVMGALGDVFGVASYRGSGGISFYLRLISGEFEPETPDAMYYQDAVLVDYVPRAELRKEDKAVIKRLDFQPAASKPRLYPKFSSFKPGYLPWFLEEREAVMLTEDLRKTMAFAAVVKERPEAFETHPPTNVPFFPANGVEPLTFEQLQWHSLAVEPLAADPPAVLDDAVLASLQRLPQHKNVTWDVSAFYTHAAIHQAPRPFFSKMALCMETQNGMILNFSLGSPDMTMTSTAAKVLAASLEGTGIRPGQVRTDSLALSQTLAPLAEALGIRIQFERHLPTIADARQSLAAFAQGKA